MMEYGLIGERLSHSFSARIHESLTGEPYALREISPGDLPGFLRERRFRGINVTIPYKKAVIPYLDALSPEAAESGSVNTIVNRDGRLTGYNTDIAGFEAMLRSVDVSLNGRKVLLIGRGGVALTAAFSARRALSLRTAFAVRTVRSAGELPLGDPERLGEFEVIVNCTPVGMYPDIDSSPLDISGFPHLRAVLDCVYNPLRPPLVLDALERGVPAAAGLTMLVEQARLSAGLFRGADNYPAFAENCTPSATPPRGIRGRDTEAFVRELTASMTNIVLCGMPSSGKTTLGRLLAEKLSREFIDTDELVERRSGRSIPTIFRESGERAFRGMERDVIRELSPRQGLVISLGGGAVLDPVNVRRLKLNGKLILLRRNIALCRPGGGRPLTRSREELEDMLLRRGPVYAAAAEAVVVNNSTLEEAVAGLEEVIGRIIV